MLPGATGPLAELAALITPPALIDGAVWAQATVRPAIRHAPVQSVALNEGIDLPSYN